ncbi:hypothetical protein PIROE2DRAFT_4756, partial [Piromyces sp. E2]
DGGILDKYAIPADENFLNKEVMDAIKILELISEGELMNDMIFQQDILSMYESERKEGKDEGIKEEIIIRRDEGIKMGRDKGIRIGRDE